MIILVLSVQYAHMWLYYGKLLILCDEDPRSEDKLTIRDKYFLDSEMWDPEDNSDMLFVYFDFYTWR